MSKNRDFLTIIADILKAAHPSASKTRIMHNANLSFQLLKKYLALTINAGFIETNGTTYTLTPHGQHFLNRYKNYQGHHTKIQKLLTDLNHERNQLTQLCNKPKHKNLKETKQYENIE